MPGADDAARSDRKGERRLKERRPRGESPDKSAKSRGRRRRDEQSAGAWLGGVLSHLFPARCCSEISICQVRDRMGAKAAEEQRRRKERKDRRRQRRGEEDGGKSKTEKLTNQDGSALASTADDGEDSETDYSRQTSVRSSRTADIGRQSARSTRSNQDLPPRSSAAKGDHGSRPSDRTLRRPSASASAGSEPVRVVNLSDFRGQELPTDGFNDGDGGGFSARSHRSARSEGGRSVRSEGGRSAKSTRSAAQSEGGQSVASTSVREYMSHLSKPRSPSEVKKMVKDFVRQMVKGREMAVLRSDGATKQVVCGLSRELDTFKMKAGEQTKKVRLSEVIRIVHGPEGLADLETPLDSKCSTLELESSECISFQFAAQEAAELFTLCMQMFVDGLKKR